MQFDYNSIPDGIKLIKPLHYKKIVSKSQPINLEDPDLFEKMEKLGWRLVKSCVDGGGIGLAAPQIGIPLQAFVGVEFIKPYIWQFTGKINLFINPEFVIVKGTDRTSFPEQCLSVPGKTLNIKRPRVVSASWWGFDKNGKLEQYRETLEGYPSTLFQHELDHLNLITIIDLYERQNLKPKRGRPKGKKNKRH